MRIIATMLLIPLLGLSACTSIEDKSEEYKGSRAYPEQEGISSGAILGFIDALEEAQPDDIHSVMISRRGQIISEGWWAPYGPEIPHLLWSLSKSFTSTAIGIAQDEGLLDINDPVISFFPDEAPENPSAKLQAMRIKDLLRMNTGHRNEPRPPFLGKDTVSWVKTFLAHEVEFKPGTHFVYNSMATYMCSAILQKVSGESTLEYLVPRLFEPLGITTPTWESDPAGINVGGWGLSLRTEDILKLGNLYLQKGKWEGNQLISAAWVDEATGIQSANGSNPESDWDQGYGYQFWRCKHNAYRGDGAFGQYCIVVPDKEVVIAITSGSGDMQGIMNLVWEHLLPAFGNKILKANPESSKTLSDKMQNLAIGTVAGEKNSPLAPALTGQSFELDENTQGLESVAFNFENPAAEITLTVSGLSYTLKAGFGEYEKDLFPTPDLVSQKVAVSGAWESPDTYAINLLYYETPKRMKLSFRFEDDSVYVDIHNRATFGPWELPQIVGKAN